MSELLKINVNDHTEKKGQLTYLSWAWAWAEVLKVDPAATWIVHTYGPQGAEQPCMWIGETAMVHTSVTVNGLRRECMLPVMDHKNNALKSPDARKVSDAIMRCMTKAISMHGLGLYIYAGEDLPEGEEPPKKEEKQNLAGIRHSPLKNDEVPALPPEVLDYIKDLAKGVTDAFHSTDAEWHAAAVQQIKSEGLDDLQKMTLWAQLDSKTRTAFKKVEQSMQIKEPA
jgi:hypothetical protein